jgi:hypothetical protein
MLVVFINNEILCPFGFCGPKRFLITASLSICNSYSSLKLRYHVPQP